MTMLRLPELIFLARPAKAIAHHSHEPGSPPAPQEWVFRAARAGSSVDGCVR
jgi:hypothetical protein